MSGNSDDYSESHLRKTKWGDIRRLEDGSWQTTWTITFKENGDPVIDSFVYRDTNVGFESHLVAVGPREAELVVTSSEHAMSAVNYPPTYSSFRIVNERIGEIEHIQDLPRDWYAPFR